MFILECNRVTICDIHTPIKDLLVVGGIENKVFLIAFSKNGL